MAAVDGMAIENDQVGYYFGDSKWHDAGFSHHPPG